MKATDKIVTKTKPKDVTKKTVGDPITKAYDEIIEDAAREPRRYVADWIVPEGAE